MRKINCKTGKIIFRNLKKHVVSARFYHKRQVDLILLPDLCILYNLGVYADSAKQNFLPVLQNSLLVLSEINTQYKRFTITDQ